MPRGGASIKAGVLRAGRPTNNVGSGHTGRTRSDTGGLWGRKAARSAWAIGAAGDREPFTKYENEDNIDNDERYQNSDNGGTSEDSEDSGEDDSRYSDGLHFPPTLAREWNPRSSDITPAERAEAALGAFLITIMTLPILYLILFEVLGRYGSRLAADSERDILIVFMTVSAVACFGFLYSCISQFHGRRTLDPSWAAPRLTLFLEVHPILGWFFPITSYLRGYIGFSILRWLLNLAAMVLFVAGHTVLRPAYMEACCYGTEILQGSTPGGSCMDRSLRNTIGFSICDPDGQSENHKLFNKLGIAFVVLSCTMQLLNICTIDWDVINRIGQLQREIDEDGLRIENKDGVDRSTTINLRLIMQLMGLPKRLESLCFPGYEEPTLPETTNPFEIIRRREKAIHEHPHWAHPGLLRLLCLDPIFGFLLSVHDFTAYHDFRGFVRVFLNIFGTVLCVLSIEVLQPMHQAWCCKFFCIIGS